MKDLIFVDIDANCDLDQMVNELNWMTNESYVKISTSWGK